MTYHYTAKKNLRSLSRIFLVLSTVVVPSLFVSAILRVLLIGGGGEHSSTATTVDGAITGRYG